MWGGEGAGHGFEHLVLDWGEGDGVLMLGFGVGRGLNRRCLGRGW